MNKLIVKIIILTAAIAIKVESQAQEIKFPESFKADTTLFTGMKIAEIPQEIKTKYGVYKNPGLVNHPSTTKGLLMAGSIPNAKAIYFEIYEDIEENKMDCGFEVVQFLSANELSETLIKIDKKKDAAFLTLKNYLIIVYCDGYKNYEKRIDKMIAYCQEKLGAKLYQDGRKDTNKQDLKAEISLSLPPKLKNAPTQIDFKELEKDILNQDGFAYLRNKKRQKFAPGNYSASTVHPPYETLIFTINQDGLLDGAYDYSFATDFKESPTKQTKMQFNNGVKISEAKYLNGEIKVSTTHTYAVVKDEKDYVIVLNTSIKNLDDKKEIKTTFRNRKPIFKITTRLGKSVIKTNFEKNIIEYYNSKGQLTKFKKDGLTEEYDNNGKVSYKKEWIDGNQFVYEKGMLRYKEIKVKDKDQYLVTEYDDKGKITKEWSKGIEVSFVITDPDESEMEMTEALFNYYKAKAK